MVLKEHHLRIPDPILASLRPDQIRRTLHLTFFGFYRGTTGRTFYGFSQFIGKYFHFFTAGRAFYLYLGQSLVGFKSWTMLFFFCHNDPLSV